MHTVMCTYADKCKFRNACAFTATDTATSTATHGILRLGRGTESREPEKQERMEKFSQGWKQVDNQANMEARSQRNNEAGGRGNKAARKHIVKHPG